MFQESGSQSMGGGWTIDNGALIFYGKEGDEG